MDYFDWYDLEPTMSIDQRELKKKYYKKSRTLHPDFHTLADDSHQVEMLEQASFNNEAYKTLSDFDSRLKYLLDLFEQLQEEGKNEVPQLFLMEMMDLNEMIMELEMAHTPDKLKAFDLELDQYFKNISSGVEHLLKASTAHAFSASDWKALADYYLKRRYLRRLQQSAEKISEGPMN